jgi:hypothetical protein
VPGVTRAYAWFAGIFLLLQGTSTLAFRLVPALDRAFPPLLEQTRMVPSHSLLHIATALVAFGVLRWGGGRGAWLFALGFGLFYVALAGLGMASGSELCLGLQPFDHPFHILLGGLGLLALAIDVVHARRGTAVGLDGLSKESPTRSPR